MAAENFDACLAKVLVHEGGWADHPSDPGGATMKGITIGTYSRYKKRDVSKAELKAIPDADVRRIYKAEYWDKVKGDDLPAGLDYVAFDGAVNSGPQRGGKWLQQALGVNADGRIGPQTLARAKALDAGGKRSVIEAACTARMTFLRGLRTFPTFGKGWTARVEGVRRDALAMVGPTIPATAPTPPAQPQPPVAAPSQPARPEGLWAWLRRVLRGK